MVANGNKPVKGKVYARRVKAIAGGESIEYIRYGMTTLAVIITNLATGEVKVERRRKLPV